VIHAVVTAHVNASADFVRTLFEDPENWAKLFPATIRGAHVVRRDQHRAVVKVSHIEGKVVNILQFISPARIDLTEFKRRYTATFTNEFIPDGEGMCYRITGIICLRWPYKLLSPFLKPIVAARKRRFIVDPLKGAAEHNR
jgi:hypothetical protein